MRIVMAMVEITRFAGIRVFVATSLFLTANVMVQNMSVAARNVNKRLWRLCCIVFCTLLCCGSCYYWTLLQP